MARVSTATEGLYAEVSAANLPDGGDLKLEVADSNQTVVQTLPLTVAGEVATIDVSTDVAQTWPDDVLFRLRATMPEGSVTSRWMTNGSGGINWVRRGTQEVDIYSVLDIPHALASVEFRTTSDNVVTELDAGSQYKVFIDLQDTEGVYAADGAAADAAQLVLMDVDIGSETFVRRVEGTNTNEYLYTAPTSNTSPRDATFTVGKYEDAERTNINLVSFSVPLVVMEAPPPAVTGQPMTFAQIRAAGTQKGVYNNDMDYVMEFMYQNPNARYWSVSGDTVSVVPTPTAPADAIELPAPSGGDDTSAIESFINSRSGGTFVGSGGVYIFNQLNLNVPCTIFKMPSVPNIGAGIVVNIRSSNVDIFESPISCLNMASAYIGWYFHHGVNNCDLIDSGCSDIYHRNDQNAAGVYIRGCSDLRIAGGRFVNIVNTTNNQKTARANAFWMNGGGNAAGKTTKNVLIYNNIGENYQSDGHSGGNQDAEFFTIQSYASTNVAEPTRIFGNRTLNAGKRLVKFQASNCVCNSNYCDLPDKFNGPLAPLIRKLFAVSGTQFSDNTFTNNNRIRMGAESRFDFICLFSNQVGSATPQDNLHFDGNEIEFLDSLPASANNVPVVFGARNTLVARSSTGSEPTNSSANNNVITGPAGAVKWIWNFDHGIAKTGGSFEHVGNEYPSSLYSVSEYKSN